MRLIVVLLLFGLTACDGSTPSPRKSGSSSGTATPPSATPTAPRTGPLTTGPNVRPGEKPPELANAAKQHDVTGALNFAIYYFKAVDWSFATNDPALIEDLAAESCSACKRISARLAALGTSGRKLVGGRIKVVSTSIAVNEYSISADYVVRVATEQDAEAVSSSASPMPQRTGGGKAVSLVFVRWAGTHWTVREMTAT